MEVLYMTNQKAYIFGYSKKNVFVAEELKNQGFSLTIVVQRDEAYERAKRDGYPDVLKLDMTDDIAIEKLNIEEDDHLVCIMEDNHFNVFLTLSLHSLFPKNRIIALSNSFHTTQKLKMAGATRVIDLYQVSANRIYNILYKPLATKLVDNLLSPDSELSIREIIIPEESFLDKIKVDDFDFSKYGIILVGMIDRRLSNQFLFITSGLEHQLDRGDTIVCIGYNDDLDRFQMCIEQKNFLEDI
jgi:voltage-gated potassium channel